MVSKPFLSTVRMIDTYNVELTSEVAPLMMVRGEV